MKTLKMMIIQKKLFLLNEGNMEAISINEGNKLRKLFTT